MTTVTLSTLKGDFFRHQAEYWSGTATAGDTHSFTDANLRTLVSEMWPTKAEGMQVRLLSGLASGDIRLVTSVDRTEGVAYPNRDFSAAVANTDTYEILGNVIYAGQPLTDVFNDTLRRLRPIRFTQVSLVTNQQLYDITTTVALKANVVEVWIRQIDQANLAPYWWREVWNWTVREIPSTIGTPILQLDLGTTWPNDGNQTLWVEHYAPFTAFSTDASTVDDTFRDWIVWETLLTFGRRRQQGGRDSQRWKGLETRAREELATIRPMFQQRRAQRIKPQGAPSIGATTSYMR